jgi:DNA-binding CsgD family transcriptional regulator
MRVQLNQVAFDAGTQIRAAIDQQVVSDYADAMTSGATFPPIVLFHDGNQHYLADGFHRFMAAQRNQFRDIDADVRPGTKEDALWFALGANKTNGKRLTEGDKKNAVLIALQTWKDYSAGRIADQIGCSQDYVSHIRTQVMKTFDLPDRVIGKDGKTYNATAGNRHPNYDAVVTALKKHEPLHSVAERLNMGVRTVSAIRDEAGLSSGPDKSKAAVAKRRDQMRTMAADGYSVPQIAERLDIDERTCRGWIIKDGIDVPADRAVGRTKRHDSNRIVEQIVMDAANLTEGVNLVEFSSLIVTGSANGPIPSWPHGMP